MSGSIPEKMVKHWNTLPLKKKILQVADTHLENFKAFLPCILSTYGIKTNWCHYLNFIYIFPDLYMFRAHRPSLRRVHTAVHTTIGSVSVLLWPCALCTRPEQHRHWTNGCVNSCVNSPEDGFVGPKHVEIRQYINKIEIVTSVGFYSICWKDARYKRIKTR